MLLIARANEIRGVDLSQPYYHTIPTISLPQVLNPIQLEYLAKNTTLYWVDSQVNEVKRTGLTTGPPETLIDTGLENPTGLAVDWLADLLFISSQKGIIVCNLNGEYSSNLILNENVKSLAVDPNINHLYWISVKNNDTNATIIGSMLDGSKQIVLVENISGESKSLTADRDSNRLYWLSDFEIYFFDIDKKATTHLRISQNFIITAIAVYKGLIYYADDDGDQSIHSINKTNTFNNTLLRNNTSGVLALRIYDPSEQKGNNPCGKNNGGCQHLCLPIYNGTFSCKCATGYVIDPKNIKNCLGVSELLLYSINWEIRGLPINGSNETNVLGPVSRVSMATTIDFLADEDLIFWGDSDHGTITSIGRDGTKRKVVVEQNEGMENVPVDWLSGIAIDWIAKNLYWSNPKHGVIEVAKLNSPARYVLLYDIEKPTSLAIDPVEGILVWVGGQKIGKSYLDGSNRQILLDSAVTISDVALDYTNKHIYWCDTAANTIERMKYDGSEKQVLLNHSLENPTSLTLMNKTLYWMDA